MAALPFCIRLKLLNFGGKFVLLLEYARTFTQCIKAYTFTSPSHGKSSHISEQFDQFGAEIFVQFHQIARKCGFGIFRLISFGQRTFLPCSKLQPELSLIFIAANASWLLWKESGQIRWSMLNMNGIFKRESPYRETPWMFEARNYKIRMRKRLQSTLHLNYMTEQCKCAPFNNDSISKLFRLIE